MHMKNIIYVLIAVAIAVSVFVLVKRAPEPVAKVPENIEEKVVPPKGENPEGEADPKRMRLDMNEWHWISTTYSDGKIITPTDSKKFGITFKNDGTFSASTDCNGIGGNYKVKDNLITFSDMMGTLMYCEGSKEGEFRKSLEQAASYFFTSRGELILDLKFDSGSVILR